MEYLEAMDSLRSSVNLRAYGQRDPIVEYKKEGLQMFKGMERAFREQVFSLIMTINTEDAIRVESAEEAPKTGNLVLSHKESPTIGTDKSAEQKIGRNDPCWCGKKKPDGTPVKFKHCHGK